MLADAGQHLFDCSGVQRARTRNALERHVIHIAAGHPRHLRHALVGAGGGEQKDQVHAMRAQAGGKGFAFFGWVVHDEHAINACRGRIAHKGALAVNLVVAFHGVGIAHQHHGRGAVALAEFAHMVQHLNHADTQTQSFFTRFLDDRAVGHGVGKRHTQLDHVGPGIHHAVHERGGDIGKREARGHIGNQRRAALRLECGKCGFDAAHLTTLTGCSPPLTDCPWQLGRQ